MNREMLDPIVGYKLVPVMKSEFSGMQPASGSCCPLSRRFISGCGGRSGVFHPSVIQMLLHDSVFASLACIRLREIETEKINE